MLKWLSWIIPTSIKEDWEKNPAGRDILFALRECQLVKGEIKGQQGTVVLIDKQTGSEITHHVNVSLKDVPEESRDTYMEVGVAVAQGCWEAAGDFTRSRAQEIRRTAESLREQAEHLKKISNANAAKAAVRPALSATA